MRVVHINTFPYKATGQIMFQVHNYLIESGEESYVVWGRGRNPENENEYSIYDKAGMLIHGICTRLFDITGFCSIRATKKLIKYLNSINPEIIHLHNVHGYYLNIKMLFEYIKKKNIKVVWTLHDCWPITGHCVYFDSIKCNRWKDGCFKCPQKHTYPVSMFLDRSKPNWRRKKELYDGIDMTVVTVSEWLKTVVQASILKEKNIVAIPNGISEKEYYKKENDIKGKFGIEGKKLILGVASEWTERKGLSDFEQLAELLPKDKYVVMVIGVTEEQKKKLSKNVIGLNRTNNKEELLEYYSAADIYFNASVEETMGMTTVEALACGTLSIVYNATALPEVLNFDYRFIAEKRNVPQVAEMIESLDWNNYQMYLQEMSIERYSLPKMQGEYLKVYKSMVMGGNKV